MTALYIRVSLMIRRVFQSYLGGEAWEEERSIAIISDSKNGNLLSGVEMRSIWGEVKRVMKQDGKMRLKIYSGGTSLESLLG
eukprot:CAMPEP_0168623950 /NCGR_PEP_ID=MMETSP0449_2-20121227/9119_1 /TAXON_ID=1082188 /ORGANISM="Strombidium rassoulzadegani, Strain ras09" /LENGTH=81 /DNA_ID=CAMNT_0008665407 /DNA_START=46 /DNA_END=291 /DNA_ORIENTATION=-